MSLLTRALEFAQTIHENQKRRDGLTPYIQHPLSVAALVLKFGGTEAQAAAALLHDTIEDPRASEAQLKEFFGETVSGIVYTFKDPIESNDWQVLRKAYLDKLRSVSEDALLVVGCEEFHELTDLMQDLRMSAPVEVLKKYPTHIMNLCWYFKEIMVLMNSKFSSPRYKKLVSEYASQLKVLQEKVFEGA